MLICGRFDSEQSLVFSSKLVELQYPRREKKFFLLGMPPSFLASRGFAARRLCACTATSSTLKKTKRLLEVYGREQCSDNLLKGTLFKLI